MFSYGLKTDSSLLSVSYFLDLWIYVFCMCVWVGVCLCVRHIWRRPLAFTTASLVPTGPWKQSPSPCLHCMLLLSELTDIILALFPLWTGGGHMFYIKTISKACFPALVVTGTFSLLPHRSKTLQQFETTPTPIKKYSTFTFDIQCSPLFAGVRDRRPSRRWRTL